jgi:hypothetical protein
MRRVIFLRISLSLRGLAVYLYKIIMLFLYFIYVSGRIVTGH